jgi:hypothetical protein
MATVGNEGLKIELDVVTVVVCDEPGKIARVGEEAERVCEGRLGISWTGCSYMVNEVGLDALFGAGIDKKDVTESWHTRSEDVVARKMSLLWSELVGELNEQLRLPTSSHARNYKNSLLSSTTILIKKKFHFVPRFFAHDEVGCKSRHILIDSLAVSMLCEDQDQ